jgi:hypothetical protein
VIFEKKAAAIRVEIVNPNKQGGSKTAAYTGTHQDKPFAGAGRDALAQELGVPAYRAIAASTPRQRLAGDRRVTSQP